MRSPLSSCDRTIINSKTEAGHSQR
uniref:Uncharacterized protein n=1 Tax=Ralstonia syzygii R24 TaxID=907261 RepID=G3A3V2_9RALS|nr:hypothetical protein RALSY_30310 [Ralstonia syzygii R24]